MTPGESDMRALSFERLLAHPPEKVWRALTKPHLIGEWLMQADFETTVGATFTMMAEWGRVTGTVLAVEPERMLSYTWNGPGLTSKVTWLLTPQGNGTLLQLAHTNIPAESKLAYHGAKAGWPRFLKALETLLERQGVQRNADNPGERSR